MVPAGMNTLVVRTDRLELKRFILKTSVGVTHFYTDMKSGWEKECPPGDRNLTRSNLSPASVTSSPAIVHERLRLSLLAKIIKVVQMDRRHCVRVCALSGCSFGKPFSVLFLVF